MLYLLAMRSSIFDTCAAFFFSFASDKFEAEGQHLEDFYCSFHSLALR